MQYPSEELEYWACFFSIDDNGDKPIIKPQEISVEQSMKDLIRVANL